MIKKIELPFRVDLNQLEKYTEVKESKSIVFIRPEALEVRNILGVSGLKMARAGFTFDIEKDDANKFIKRGLAAEVK